MAWAGAAVFYHQLGIMVRTGLTLAQALEHAAAASPGWHGARAKAWSSGCAGGQSLAEQLERDGEEAVATALVRAGEVSGQLPRLCSEIAGLYEHRLRLRGMIIARSIYPALLATLALMAPGVVGVIARDAPVWTMLVGPAALWGGVIAVVVANAVMQRSGLMARLALAWPLRGLVMPLLAANTCLVLRAALSAGMLMPRALDLAADACGNQVMAARLRAAAGDLNQGRLPNLTAAVAAAGLPHLVVMLVSNGEIAGALDDTLDRAAAQQREAFQERTLWTARILTGLFYAAAAAGVGWMVISMYSGYLSQVREIAEGMD